MNRDHFSGGIHDIITFYKFDNTGKASCKTTKLNPLIQNFDLYREGIRLRLHRRRGVASGALPAASHAHLSIGQFNRYVYKCNISIVVARLLSVRLSVATANEFRPLIASRCVRALCPLPPPRPPHVTY